MPASSNSAFTVTLLLPLRTTTGTGTVRSAILPETTGCDDSPSVAFCSRKVEDDSSSDCAAGVADSADFIVSLSLERIASCSDPGALCWGVASLRSVSGWSSRWFASLQPSLPHTQPRLHSMPRCSWARHGKHKPAVFIQAHRLDRRVALKSARFRSERLPEHSGHRTAVPWFSTLISTLFIWLQGSEDWGSESPLRGLLTLDRYPFTSWESVNKQYKQTTLNGLCLDDDYTIAQRLEHRWLQARVPGSSPGGDSQFFLQTFPVCLFPSKSVNILWLGAPRVLVCTWSVWVTVRAASHPPVWIHRKCELRSLKKTLNGLCLDDDYTIAQRLEHRWLQARVPGSSPGGDSQFFLQTFPVCLFPSKSVNKQTNKLFRPVLSASATTVHSTSAAITAPLVQMTLPLSHLCPDFSHRMALGLEGPGPHSCSGSAGGSSLSSNQCQHSGFLRTLILARSVPHRDVLESSREPPSKLRPLICCRFYPWSSDAWLH